MIMNKKVTGYESPVVKGVDIQAEGVLCNSLGGNFDDWEKGDDLFDWE